MKFWKIFLFFFPLSVIAKTTSPQIFLSFPPFFHANEEIKILVKISNLKNTSYDLKISIEKENVLSEIYNEKEKKWQSSLYYLKNLFVGPHFEGNFKLRLKREYLNFEGEAEIIVRVRQTGKANFLEKRGKIKILKPEIAKEKILSEEKFSASLYQNFKETPSFFPFFFAVFFSFFSTFFFYLVKKRLRK